MAEPQTTSAPVVKAVIPAAGLGTRFVPATKAQPKEMLPVVDKPAIQYVVEEAASAGLSDVLIITSRGKSSIEDHFDDAPILEEALEKKGDDARLARVRESSGLAQLHYVRQGEALGLGHAVLQAKAHVGDEPFVVMLGDDLIDARDEILPEMIRVREERGGSVLCLMEVPRESVHLYGCAAIEPTDQEGVVRVTDLVEKPAPGEEPSNLVVVGRYVIDPAVFEVLENTRPGRGGEIQLTDALLELAKRPVEAGGTVHGVVFTGRRYDTGDKLSYLKANISLGTENPEIGPALLQWLREFAAETK